MGMAWASNIYVWIGASIFLLLMTVLLTIFLIVLGKKTHAMVEFKAWMKGYPIAQFYQENRYCEWKPVSPEAGIIVDKDYGAFIINERATYIDKLTKNVFIPFDASVGVSINVRAAKLADDLQYIVKDEEQMSLMRQAIAKGAIAENESIDVLKTSIHFGAIKNMMTAIIPHNINAKIEKTIASRMKSYGNVNINQIILIFVAIFGAIGLGALVLKLTLGSSIGD